LIGIAVGITAFATYLAVDYLRPKTPCTCPPAAAMAKTSIIDPIFKPVGSIRIVDPTFSRGSAKIIDPIFGKGAFPYDLYTSPQFR
jgi:hypothetical protein